MLWQPPLPGRYRALSAASLSSAIHARRQELGEQLLILGHHYQQDDVIAHADLVGDSLKLSRLAAEEAPRRGARWIVFCGVHFMAETADLLTDDDVHVILPDLAAGCSMADMAEYDDCLAAWEAIQRAHASAPGETVRVIPITYVNSSAAVKAFVGARGGACCTSSNAASVFEWALAGGTEPRREGERIQIIFLPDQHLGRNTAHHKGFVTEVDAARTGATAQSILWDPRRPHGGTTPAAVHAADVVLWAGHCSVHKLFRPEHVQDVRTKDPSRGVIVHPECSQEVVDLADEFGSTERILNRVRASAPGESWAVGTEIHLVDRLAIEMAPKGVDVQSLSGCQCLCTTMYRIDQGHLLWVLDELAAGRVVNPIRVHPEARAAARQAVDRMLASGAGSASTPTTIRA